MAQADTLEVGVAKSATNAARSDTLLVTAPKDRMEEDTAVRVKAVTVVVDMEAVVAKDRPATRVEDMATCLVTAHKVKNATTVRTLQHCFIKHILIAAGGEVGHLSRDCPSEPSSERVCYKCKQPGHVQAACPN